MYKNVYALLIACCIGSVSMAQSSAGIAPFTIQLTNNKVYTYKDLKKNVPTVLIYFSPTCDHCKAFMKELVKHETALKNKQVILVTYLSLEETKAFDSLYNISSKPYFKIGTEGYTFIVQKYYNIQRFPYIVLYDKQLKLVKKLSPEEKPGVLAGEVSSFN